MTELTSRAREIFRRVVEEYIESGQPVGSKTLAADGTLNLSPASIRSVLADLETLGFLAAPHTSAGRLPTDAGLRRNRPRSRHAWPRPGRSRPR
jgi:heat-inducible transcriptional repressor